MAITGLGRQHLKVKLFDNATQTWAAAYTEDAEQGYAGAGFQFPSDKDNWVNRPTGELTYGGMVMGFPRSAEPTTNPPIPSSGWLVWEI